MKQPPRQRTIKKDERDEKIGKDAKKFMPLNG